MGFHVPGVLQTIGNATRRRQNWSLLLKGRRTSRRWGAAGRPGPCWLRKLRLGDLGFDCVNIRTGRHIRQYDLNARHSSQVASNPIVIVRLVGMRRGMPQRQRLNENEQGCEECQTVRMGLPDAHGYSVTFS